MTGRVVAAPTSRARSVARSIAGSVAALLAVCLAVSLALDETTTLKVKPVFPAGTEEIRPRHSSFASGAAVQRARSPAV